MILQTELLSIQRKKQKKKTQQLTEFREIGLSENVMEKKL